MPLELTSDQLLALAAEVLDIESRAVDALRSRLDCGDTRQHRYPFIFHAPG